MIRVALLILAALGLGTFAAVGTFFVQEQNTQQALNEYEKILVLFTEQSIPQGTSLDAAKAQGLVTTRLFPKALLPESSIIEYGDLSAASVATRDLTANTLLLEGDFEPVTNMGSGSLLDQSFAAVSLTLNEYQQGGGLIGIGSTVGVLSTQENPETGLLETRVLFPSVKVLAIAGLSDGGSLIAPNINFEGVVTLSIPSAQVAKLLTDYSNGEITLILVGDGESVPQAQY